MNILKKNTIPSFQIVPRRDLNISEVFKIELKNESSQKKQNIICAVDLLANENFTLSLETFPTGKIGDKFSYSLFDNTTNELILMGKLMIVSENENIQNYEKSINSKYYS